MASCFTGYVVIITYVIALMVIQTGLVAGADDDSYVIDTLIVVDDVMFDRWRDYLSANMTRVSIEETSRRIREYVALVVHQANERLDTIRSHASFGIKIQVVDIRLDEAVLAFVPENILTRNIRAGLALEVFETWVVDEGLMTKYDHLMLLTGKPMESVYEGASRGAVRGRANIGQVCDRSGQSVSVVQDLGGFQSVHVVAHELGHSLGAVHDGDTGAETCPESDLYLMSTRAQAATDTDSDVTMRNPWFLSSCSADAISGNIMSVLNSDKNCLSTKSMPIPEFTATADVAPGQVYNASEQCKMLYGPDAALCLGASFTSLDGICTRMFCSKSKSSCAQHYAAEGTSCGNKKWCRMGQCVESEDAPEMDTCPYGDTALLLGAGTSCPDYISRYPSACYRDEIREICCQSCADIHTGSDVCPYGDKRIGCTPEVCEQAYPNGTLLAELCCGTCDYTAARECRDVLSIDGYSCPERVTAYGNQECYNGTVAFHCCGSCDTERRYNVTGCEYGDFVKGKYCETQARSDYSGCTRRLNPLCCRTCDPDFRRKEDGDPDIGSSVSPSLLLIFFPILFLIQVI